MADESFVEKKARILYALEKPAHEYYDESPKGSLDDGIRPLLDLINGLHDYVTTSSCAGRMCVFAEGESVQQCRDLRLSGNDQVDETSDEGGHNELAMATNVEGERQAMYKLEENSRPSALKSGGGRWLFVSHEPFSLQHQGTGTGAHIFQSLGLVDEGAERHDEGQTGGFVHLKFEPMVRTPKQFISIFKSFKGQLIPGKILHVVAQSIPAADALLVAAQQAGFRESGLSNLRKRWPLVTIRTQGLGLDFIVGMIKYLPHSRSSSSQPCMEPPEVPKDQNAFEQPGHCALHGFPVSLFPENIIRTFLRRINDRFDSNAKRIERFRSMLIQNLHRSSARAASLKTRMIKGHEKRMHAASQSQTQRSTLYPPPPQNDTYDRWQDELILADTFKI